MDISDWLSLALAALAVLVPLVAVVGRLLQKKGIGWQFIRFTTIVVALPLAGILALNGALQEGVLALLAGALGYAFGQAGIKENPIPKGPRTEA